MTRAKERLFIYTDSDIFDRLPADLHVVDQNHYDLPDQLTLQLSHKDVNLGYFKFIKRDILSLRAGEQLRFENYFLYPQNSKKAVAQLSQKMQSELMIWSEKGYSVSCATIRFIVAWKPKDAPRDEEESAVLLMDLDLKKDTEQVNMRNATKAKSQ